MNAGTHENPVFQKAWNKYGQENFVWFQLEETTPETQFHREQWYLDNFRPFVDEGCGFNIAKDALRPPNHKGKKRSDEFKKKVSESQSGENSYWYGVKGEGHPCFGLKRSEEVKKKMSERKKGRKLSEETKKKLSLIHKGRKKTPDHIKKVVESRLANGRYKVSEETREKIRNYNIGRKLSDETKTKMRESGLESFKIKSPDGNILEVKGKTDFVKEHKLSFVNLLRLLKGDRDYYKGWTRAD